MGKNLLKPEWMNLDPSELRLLLWDLRLGPGQYTGRTHERNRLHLPQAGPDCRLVLLFERKKIARVEPGPKFNNLEWARISQSIVRSVLTSSPKVGREYSFHGRRVCGSWRGDRSGVQILPPPDDAPRAPVEYAEHPFVLEFPIMESDRWAITNHRRLREHRNYTLLLNVLLTGRTSLQPRQPEHFWATIRRDDGGIDVKWVQHSYLAGLGSFVADHLSPGASERLQRVEPQSYYTDIGGSGTEFQIPSDLDASICAYMNLCLPDRARFNRSMMWLDVASRVWNISISTYFVALFSAVEALTERGKPHEFMCPACGKPGLHEDPGVTRRFKQFLTKYAPDPAIERQLSRMYELRSGILHGSDLMYVDEEFALGWDPPERNEEELQRALSSVVKLAMRNWLRSRGKDVSLAPLA